MSGGRVRLGAHHDGSGLYVPEGTPALGDVVPVRIRVPADGADVRAVHLRMVRDAEPVYARAVPDGVDTATGERWYAAEMPVHNPVTSYRVLLDRGPRGYSWLNGTGEHDRDVSDVNDFRVTTFAPGPDWALDAVVYQIFPDRFASSGVPRALPGWATPASWDDEVVHRGPETGTQLFGGDLPGIAAHLDHIQELGATAVYLTPIFPARSNHRYDASSFDEVDPLLGGNAALADLAAAVHARGMRLIGDLTSNHSGDDHAWFRTARADPASPERDFYYFGPGAGYAAWMGVPSLPKFDHDSPVLRERLFGAGDSVAARWLREPYLLDGWRVDVANMTGRHGAFDHAGAVARTLRATIDQVRPDGVLLAEHGHDASADLRGDGWQGTMNYSGFTRPVWSWLTAPDHGLTFLGMPTPVPRRPGDALVASMTEFAAAVPWKVWTRNWNLLDSHDTARIRTVTGDPDLVAVGAGLLLTSVGTPMIFAGDELGLTGVDGEDARRPMPWGRPETWDVGTHRRYRALIALRRTHPALRRGGLRWVITAADAVGFLRETATERLLVVAARARWGGARLPAALAGGEVETLYGDHPLALTDDALTVPGDGPHVGVWRLG